jgi:hypothetical protein
MAKLIFILVVEMLNNLFYFIFVHVDFLKNMFGACALNILWDHKLFDWS